VLLILGEKWALFLVLEIPIQTANEFEETRISIQMIFVLGVKAG
jgi:hypothetical protein